MSKFPQGFVRECCLAVKMAKQHCQNWSNEELPAEEADKFAECSFVSAGAGMKCENCGKFISPGDPYFEEIKNFYKEDSEEGMKAIFLGILSSDSEYAIAKNGKHIYFYRLYGSKLEKGQVVSLDQWAFCLSIDDIEAIINLEDVKDLIK
jgi:hypothetical protein